MLFKRFLFVGGMALFLSFSCLPVVASDHSSAPLDINQWILWLSNEYTGSHKSPDKRFTGYFPQGAAGVLYTDDIWWGGVAHDGRSPAIRVGGASYRSGVVPGWIVKEGTTEAWPQPVSPSDPRVRIYRVRRDIFTIDADSLRQDAAVTFNLPLEQITETLLDSLRRRYIKDWNEWPVDLGAPFEDTDGNGHYDPRVDIPGLLGADQVIWYVVNDANPAKTLNFLGSPPLGIELQVTAWAYRWGLSQTVFRRYRLINKSGAVIDSMFFSQLAEPDLGDYSDNLSGCDSAASLGFVYNGQAHDALFDLYSMPPPSVGYLLLQGPAVKDDTAWGVIDFKPVYGVRNLPMTSFWLHQTGGSIPFPEFGVYEQGTLDAYAILNGYAMYWGSELIPMYKVSVKRREITKFMANGNPITQQGDIDGKGNSVGPGVRYFCMNAGPFTMQPGEYQDIIIATIGALPNAMGDQYNSLAHLFRMIGTIKKAYREFLDYENTEFTKASRGSLPGGQNERPQLTAFPNPFNQSVRLHLSLPVAGFASLEIYNVSGQKVRTLFVGQVTKTNNEWVWDGKDERGRVVPSGLYFARLQGKAHFTSKKLLLVR
jgi:hypothetical protein